MSKVKLHISGSKSISNRFLIMEALAGQKVEVQNLSNSDDALVMQKILSNQNETNWNVGHAGTAMRFLTAFAATQNRTISLSGSERMHQRPIGPLVDALRKLGAEINYLGVEGYPPLKINGQGICGGELDIDGQMSSQFISALAMIAPRLSGGLQIEIQNKLVSRPYLAMTLGMMRDFGIDTKWVNSSIQIPETKYTVGNYQVESDWSSASYWFSFVAMGIVDEISISNYFTNSYQGDAALIEIFKPLGVDAILHKNELVLRSSGDRVEKFSYDFHEQPDIAQTVAVCCFELGIEAELFGLETLPIKETDRLLALKIELAKLGGVVQILNQDTILLAKRIQKIPTETVQIETYKDHRMAMCFAPLAFKYPTIEILDPNVVTKSYPDFWEDVARLKK